MLSTDKAHSITELIATMATLRSEGGCPWDKKQTPDSLKSYILEETHELLEAIDRKNISAIRDELGDLLLQVIFLAQIYHEQQLFDFYDIARTINEKLIRRHPHVFAEADPDLHAQRWDEIKTREREQRGQSHRLSARIPKTLPALSTARKLAGKVPPLSTETRKKKLADQVDTLLKQNTTAETADTRNLIGETIFQLACLAAQLNIDPEDAIRQKNLEVIESIDATKEIPFGQQSESQ